MNGVFKELMVQGLVSPKTGRKRPWENVREEPGSWTQGEERSGKSRDLMGK